MTKKSMLIDAAHPEEVRVAVLDNGKIEDFDFESEARKPLRGNIYLARVTRVEPSLQAAFVEYGGNRHGFLAFSEIHPDYYQIPVSDRELLQQAEAEVADLAAQLELSQRGDEDEFEQDGEDPLDENGRGFEAAENDEPNGATDSDSDDTSKQGDELVEAVNEHADDESGAVDGSVDDATDEEDEEEDVKNDAGDDQKKPDDVDNDDDGNGQDQAASADDEQPAIDIAPESDDGVEAESSETNVDAAVGSDEGDPDADGAADETSGDAANDEKTSAAKAARAARNALFDRYKDAKRKRSNLLRNYKIQEVIKRRQILLVQAVKEERGNKGAALTTYMSLAGRYCVLMPNTARGGGISRKIPSATDRRRLRRVVDSLEVPQGMGLIIRTAGAKRTKIEIKRDYDYLLRLWENIRTLTLKSIAPCLIYEEANLIKRAIRDLYDKDISTVLVEGETGYREAKDFMKMLMPSHAKNVQPYKDRAPIFLKHSVEEQLDGMYQPTVRLKSGGYIVIHQTEALIAIDVNSGRSTRERNIELTALKTNIEAAQEAARQFRLRDLAGLIVIDFIDMEESRNNRKVEKALKDGLKSDRARIQVGRISNFGLLELSRQRRRSGIVDGTTHTCPTCSGAGAVRSHEMAALRILRAIEGEAISGKVGLIVAHTSLDVSLYVLNHNRDWLKRIEDDNGVSIEILADPKKAGDVYDLEKSGAPRERTQETTVIRADQTDAIVLDDVESEAEPEASVEGEEKQEDHEDGGRKKRRRRRRRKDAAPREQSDGDQSAEEKENVSEQPSAEQTNAAAGEEEDGDKPKRRRRRGRRGGRRNRKTEGDASQDGIQAESQSDAEKADGGQDEGSSAANHSEADSVALEQTKPKDDADTRGNGAKTDQPVESPAPENTPPPVVVSGQPAPEPEDTDPASKAEKPSRKGWWQRATGL